MLVAGPPDDIAFGRQELALDKRAFDEIAFDELAERRPEVRVGKDGASLDVVGSSRASWCSTREGGRGVGTVRQALGKTTRDVMRMHPPDHFRIVARNAEHPAVMRWAWVIDKSSLPRMHPVADDVLDRAEHAGDGQLLTSMGFSAKVATWTFGVDAHLEWPVAAP